MRGRPTSSSGNLIAEHDDDSVSVSLIDNRHDCGLERPRW